MFLRVARPVEYRSPPVAAPDDAWRELLHQPSAIPGLDYELAPDREQVSHGALVRTNSLGMRDREPLPDTTPNLLRIAVVGDSFSFGWAVPVEQGYPDVLERLLAQDPRSGQQTVDVLNFSVSGYSTFHEVQVVEHRVMPFRPDALIVGYFLNDPETAPIQPLSSYFAKPAWWQRSHLLRLIAQASQRRAVARVGDNDYYRYVHRDPSRWKSVERGFQDLARLTRDAARDAARDGDGMPVLVVVFPESRAGWKNYRYQDLHDQVAGAARSAGLDVLDLAEVFARYPARQMRVAPGDPHPSPFAHRIAAQSIQERLYARHPQLFERNAAEGQDRD